MVERVIGRPQAGHLVNRQARARHPFRFAQRARGV